MSTQPPSGPYDPGEEVTRISSSSQPPGPPRSSGAKGWMMATVGLLALIVGVGVGLLINSGDDGKVEVQTVRERATVTAPATQPTTPTTTVAVTVTQPPAATVVRTATVPITVTAPAATEP